MSEHAALDVLQKFKVMARDQRSRSQLDSTRVKTC